MKKDTKFLLLIGGVLLLVYFVGRRSASASSGAMTPEATTSSGAPDTSGQAKGNSSGSPSSDPALESWLLYHYGQAAKPSDNLWDDPFAQQPVDGSTSQEDFMAGRI